MIKRLTSASGTDTGFGRYGDYQIVWNRPRPGSRPGNYYEDQGVETNGGESEIVKAYSTDNYTKWAIEYLNGEGPEANKPWYLRLCYGAVHEGPFAPAQRHLARTLMPAWLFPLTSFRHVPASPTIFKTSPTGFRMKTVPHLKGRKRATGELSSGRGIHGSDLNSWIRQYHQGVLALDEAVGKLIKTLKESGQYENTLIVFTSDQGFPRGQHGFRTKAAAYDANIRSPMIVSMPDRLPQSKVCDAPVGGADLVPTFFDFSGIDLPWQMHGRSLLPMLTEPQTCVLTQQTHRSVSLQWRASVHHRGQQSAPRT